MKTNPVLESLIRGFRIWLAIAMTAGCLFGPQNASAQPILDVVFDLDWTLIYNTTEAMASANPTNVVRYNGQAYRFSDYTLNVLRALHEIPGLRISYFSGGERLRNHAVVQALYANLNRFTKHSRFSPYLELSVEDMMQVQSSEKLPFRERFKKDLQPFFDLQSTVLVDDVLEFAIKGQERNLVFVGDTYEDRPSFDLARLENPANKKFSAPNRAAWHRERQKLIRILGILLEGRRRMLVSEKPLAFPDAVQNVIRESLTGLVDPVAIGFAALSDRCKLILK